MTELNYIELGRKALQAEAEVLEAMAGDLSEPFARIADEVNSCVGKVVFVGMGKPGHVSRKIAATFSSLGIPAIALHPGEAMHGDLGMLQKTDLVVVASYSGESDEVTAILPLLKRYSCGRLIAITGNAQSTLAREADIVQVLPRFEEADPLGLAPTSSTTAFMAYGDALAVAVSSKRGFTQENFGAYHPAGSLGKKILLKVDGLMAAEERNAIVVSGSPLTDAIAEIGRKGLGMTSVVDVDGKLIGVITDGDLRRQLEKNIDVYSLKSDDIMSDKPAVIETGSPATSALALMRNRNVSCLPVLKGGVPIGVVQMQAIVDAGIVM